MAHIQAGILSSTRNPLVRQLIKLRTSPRYRRTQGTVLLVGARALRETLPLLHPQADTAPRGIAMENNADRLPLEVLLLPPPADVSRDERLFDSRAAQEVAVRRALADNGLVEALDSGPISAAQTATVARFADARVLRTVAGLSSFSGPIGVVALPPGRCPEDQTPMRRLLVLSGVTDPGNVGTLLRTALGLGWDAVFLLAGRESSGRKQQSDIGSPACSWPHCADPFGEKALRAAAGAAFVLPIIRGCPETLRRILKRHDMALHVADILPARAGTRLSFTIASDTACIEPSLASMHDTLQTTVLVQVLVSRWTRAARKAQHCACPTRHTAQRGYQNC
jgi:hypothetical protein